MRKLLALVILLATSAFADATEEVRQAEMAFAKAFADRDQAKFFSFVADDATFASPFRTLSGKEAVVRQWSNYFKPAQAPFSWGPERVFVTADGRIGLSTGPVYGADGKLGGHYISTWRKEGDGTWKVIFDGPGAPGTYLPEDAPPVAEGFVTADDGVKLHYRKIGAAPLTIIAPLGFILHDDLRQFSDIATVITYDMRNRGRSDRVEDTSTLTIQQDVKDLEAVRRQLKVEKFVPIGYSYLGMMVAMYAMEHHDRVSRIIQLGPVPIRFDTEFPKHLTEPRETLGAPEEDVKRWRELSAQENVDQKTFCEAQAKVFSYLLVGNPANHTKVKSNCDLPNEWPENFARQMNTHFGSVKALRIEKDELRSKIKVPVLTIHGTRDRNAPYGGGREWAMTLSDARLVTVKGAAHASWLDDPATVFGSIRQFLRGEWPLGAEKVTK